MTTYPKSLKQGQTNWSPTSRDRSVLLIDPSDLFMIGIGTCLEEDAYRIVGQLEAIGFVSKEICRLQPTIVVLGPNLPEREAFQVCRLLANQQPKIRVLLFHNHAEDPLIELDAIDAGATTCLFANTPCKQCRISLATALSGYEPFRRQTIYQAAQPVHLTPRELETLHYMATELSSSEIAHMLGVATSTTRNTVQRVIEKLQVHNRHDAVTRARRRGLLQ